MFKSILEKVSNLVCKIFGISKGEAVINHYQKRYERAKRKYSNAVAEVENYGKKAEQSNNRIKKLNKILKQAAIEKDRETVEKVVIALKTEKAEYKTYKDIIDKSNIVITNMKKVLKRAKNKIEKASMEVRSSDLRKELNVFCNRMSEYNSSFGKNLQFDLDNVSKENRAEEVYSEIDVDTNLEELINDYDENEFKCDVEKQVDRIMRRYN